jgi:hypothetical protein
MEWQRDGLLLLFDSTAGVGRGMDGSTVDERVIFVAMSRLSSNHIGTRAHLQRINVVQDVLCQCAMGYDAIDHGLWKCGLHCTLKNKLQEKLQAGMDHGRSIKRYIDKAQYGRVKAHFWILERHGYAHLENAYKSPRTHQIPGVIRKYISPFQKKKNFFFPRSK